MPVYRAQRYALADFRGGLESLESAIRELVAERPARPMFRCVLAHLLARTGQRAEAARELGELTAGRCAALPVDQEWLFAISCLAETAGLLEDTEVAAGLYELLLPWAGLNVVDQCEGIRGAVARYLGILAAATGRRPEAQGHFETALELNARMGARPWLARTQEDYARLLHGDDRARAGALSEAAAATYSELGMTPAGALPVAR
jgi:hypothetical protein